MLARWRLVGLAMAMAMARPNALFAKAAPATSASVSPPSDQGRAGGRDRGIAPPLGSWRRALAESGCESLVYFPEAGGGAAVETAVLTRARPENLLGLAMAPDAYCRAVPSLVTCDEIGRERLADGRWRRRVEWELEIPLANLSGQLEVEPDADWLGVSLRFVRGDLAPGSMQVRWQAGAEGATLLWASLGANLRDANWLLRRLARRDAWTEPALRGAIVWIAALAWSAFAAAPGAATAPRPHGASVRWTGEGRQKERALGRAGGTLPGNGGGTWAAIDRAPNGRLVVVRIARQTRLPPNELLHALATQSALSSLVGWSKVRVTSSTSDHALVEAKEGIPFVNLGAEWRITFGPPLAAEAVAGAIAGAAWHFSASATETSGVPAGGDAGDSTRAPGPVGSDVVFSLAPRLEAAGWVPRRFIEAEPFLEHGLALALAYVDLRRALGAALSDKGPP